MPREPRVKRHGLERQGKVLKHLRRFGPCTSAQLAEALGLSPGSARDTVWRLSVAGKIDRRGPVPFRYSVLGAEAGQ